jgi:hypothetical protein
MPPNSNGELECAADLYKVCASVAQQFLAAKKSAVFSHPRHSSDFALFVSEGEIVATVLPFPGCP